MVSEGLSHWGIGSEGLVIKETDHTGMVTDGLVRAEFGPSIHDIYETCLLGL